LDDFHNSTELADNIGLLLLVAYRWRSRRPHHSV